VCITAVGESAPLAERFSPRRKIDSTPGPCADQAPIWRDSLYLRSEDGRSAEVRRALQLAALQVKWQPKVAESRTQSGEHVPSRSRRGSIRRCERPSRRA